MVVAFAAAFSWFVPAFGIVLLAVLAAFGLWTIVVGAQLYRSAMRLTPAAPPDAPHRAPVPVGV
jgi:hypothetical protein